MTTIQKHSESKHKLLMLTKEQGMNQQGGIEGETNTQWSTFCEAER